MVKYCECGCGQKVNHRFVSGHNLKNRECKPKPEPKLCECGCGHYASPGKRFITHHNFKGGFWTDKKRPNLWNGERKGYVPRVTEKLLKVQFKKGRVPHNKNKKMSIDTRKKQSKTRLRNFESGKVLKTNKGSFVKGVSYEERYGKEEGKMRRKKQRIDKIRYVEQQKFDGMPLYPTVGKYEKDIIDNLEQCFGYKIERQKRVAGYFLDGYCPMLKLAIEVDEPRHEKLIKEDVRREEEIKDEIGCTFLRIKIPKQMEV